MTPAVSVVMSVHNGEAWVGEAIRSVLNQTMGDLELIIINDGSTDRTGALIASTCDARVAAWHSRHRFGLTVQLMTGVALARAPLIARLDADDECVLTRLQWQCQYLAEHPEVGLLGTQAYEIDVQRDLLRIGGQPCGDGDIRKALMWRNPFHHSSVMFRRSVYDRAGGYDPGVAVAQDYDLWLRMARFTTLANLPEALVTRRFHDQQITATRTRERRLTEARIRWREVWRGELPWWGAAYAAKSWIGAQWA